MDKVVELYLSSAAQPPYPSHVLIRLVSRFQKQTLEFYFIISRNWPKIGPSFQIKNKVPYIL